MSDDSYTNIIQRLEAEMHATGQIHLTGPQAYALIAWSNAVLDVVEAQEQALQTMSGQLNDTYARLDALLDLLKPHKVTTP